MKTKISLIIAATFVMGMAFAVSPDIECQDYGFSYAFLKVDGHGTPQEYGTHFNDTDAFAFDGDPQELSWKTDGIRVAGVLRKSATNVTVLEGGTSGTVYGWETHNPRNKKISHDISHLTFCGRYPGSSSGGGGNGHGVPEFTPLTLSVAIILGVLGIAAIRRN